MYKKYRLYSTLLFCFLFATHSFSLQYAQPLLVGSSSICCGYIALVNPIIALLGGSTRALAVIAYNAHKDYLKKQSDEMHLCESAMPEATVLSERFYYEQRKNDLEKIKQELMTIKNDLQIIKGLSSSHCTHQLLRRHTYEKVNSAQPLSINQEKYLSEQQKSRLREMRDNELALLEKQICDIQFLLALHVNQLIDNLRYAQQSYDSAVTEIKAARDTWNANRNTMTYAIALRTYKGDLLYKHLIGAISQACDELLVVAEYYRVCTNQCIKDSTTIVSALDKIISTVCETKQLVLEQEGVVRNNIAIVEKHFAQRNIPVAALRNEVKNEFDKKHKERNIEVLKKVAMEKLAYSGFGGGGPKKDDNGEDDGSEGKEKEIKISEEDKDHIFRESDGHFTKDTPEVRKIIEDIVVNKNNFNGLDKHGTKWYSKITPDGKQVWAGVRDNKIRYAGVNKVPWPKDSTTGLLIRSVSSFKT